MQIVMAVGVEKRRLPLPPDCPPALARLLRECWRHSAALRPGFPEILERVRKMKEVAQAAADARAAGEELAAPPSPGALGPRRPSKFRVFTPDSKAEQAAQ
jgi:hypothetical protein